MGVRHKTKNLLALLMKARESFNIGKHSLNETALTLQRGVTGTARMLHALTHSSISRQVREQM